VPNVESVRIGEIRARGLGRRFEIRLGETKQSLKETIVRRRRHEKRELWALRDVDLDVAPREALGVIGENGSGKSTLLKLLAGIFAPTEGTLEVGGSVGSLLELGAGFHPEFTGVENVYLSGAVHGLSRRYIDEHLEEIFAFAELEDFAEMPVKTYSSGMFMRLGFSVATHVRAQVLLLDEVLAVGDEAFQQKCHAKIWDFRRSGGTIVFVSHDLAAVERLCDRAVLLEHGRIAADGVPAEVVHTYHRLLAERMSAVVPEASEPGASRIESVRALDESGSPRGRFGEGEAVTLEARLASDRPVDRGVLSIGLRDLGGRAIGTQRFHDLDLHPGAAKSVRLHLPMLPLSGGTLFVDIRLTDTGGDSELAAREAALELTVVPGDAGEAGPFRLGGSWKVEEDAEAPLAEAAER
jgi:ABC-type polysaccharide/polyol phosphate transport system ATPase subunit